MIDTDRLRPRLSPLDYWRIGASVLFLGFGGYFIVTFLVALFRPTHRPWTQLILGCLVLAYGVYRIWSAYRYVKRQSAERSVGENHEGPAR